MTRGTVAMAGLSVVGFALAVVVTTVPEPVRVRTSAPPDVVVVSDGSHLRQTGTGREDGLAWVNAFPSEVAGPVEGALRLETEAVVSPLSVGATLVRVTLQASRTAANVPPAATAQVTFFDSEVTSWHPQTDPRWREAGVPLTVEFTGLGTGATRHLFVEVDPALRWGGVLGVVSLTVNGQKLVTPIERARSLDDASADFRFSTAVLLTMLQNDRRRAELAPVAQALVADTAPGVPWREAFVERFVPPAPAVTYRSTGYTNFPAAEASAEGY